MTNAPARHPVDVYAGRQLRARRKQLKMSQAELGDVCKVSFQQLQKYEVGKNRMSCSKLFAFANKLGVSFDYFIEQNNDEECWKKELSQITGVKDREALWKNYCVAHAIRLASKSCKIH